MTAHIVQCGVTEALKGVRVSVSEAVRGCVFDVLGQLRQKTALRPSHCRDLGGDGPM